DYGQAIQRSRKVADRMAKGVEFLFRKNKITLVRGRGALKAKNIVEVAGKDGAQTLEAGRAVILATGSEPKSLPGVTIDEKTVISSNRAGRHAGGASTLATAAEPKSLPGVTIDEKTVISSNGAVRNEGRPATLIVIGAGAVGMEFADVYAAYGTQVTVLEALPRVLPVEDEESSTQIARLFGRRGITIRTAVRVKSVTPGAGGVAVEVEAEGKAETLRAEQVLMAVGRGART